MFLLNTTTGLSETNLLTVSINERLEVNGKQRRSTEKGNGWDWSEEWSPQKGIFIQPFCEERGKETENVRLVEIFEGAGNFQATLLNGIYCKNYAQLRIFAYTYIYIYIYIYILYYIILYYIIYYMWKNKQRRVLCTVSTYKLSTTERASKFLLQSDHISFFSNLFTVQFLLFSSLSLSLYIIYIFIYLFKEDFLFS